MDWALDFFRYAVPLVLHLMTLSWLRTASILEIRRSLPAKKKHVCANKHNQRMGLLWPWWKRAFLTDQSMIHLVGLGLTKSLQEFLVLQYFATDSASSWHSLLQEWFPHVRWTSPGRLRHQVEEIYDAVHIAPSHRRMPHPCWTGPMNLLLSLL